MVAQKLIQYQQKVHHLAVVPAPGKQLDEPHEFRLGLFVFLVQQLLQYGGLQKVILSLPAQLHIAGQPQHLEILPNEPVAEGMDGTDLGISQQKALPAQGGVFRLLLHLFVQPLGNPLPHFLGRRIGKGHDEQPVDIQGVFPVGDERKHPFGQHGRFAAARRRRDQQIAAPCGNGFFLGKGPLAFAHSFFSFPPSSRWGASGSVLLQSPA